MIKWFWIRFMIFYTFYILLYRGREYMIKKKVHRYEDYYIIYCAVLAAIYIILHFIMKVKGII